MHVDPFRYFVVVVIAIVLLRPKPNKSKQKIIIMVGSFCRSIFRRTFTKTNYEKKNRLYSHFRFSPRSALFIVCRHACPPTEVGRVRV